MGGVRRICGETHHLDDSGKPQSHEMPTREVELQGSRTREIRRPNC